MYHWGGKKQRSRGSSLFALLLLPLRVHSHLTRLVFRHFKCNTAFAHLLCFEMIFPVVKKIHSFLFSPLKIYYCHCVEHFNTDVNYNLNVLEMIIITRSTRDHH